MYFTRSMRYGNRHRTRVGHCTGLGNCHKCEHCKYLYAGYQSLLNYEGRYTIKNIWLNQLMHYVRVCTYLVCHDVYMRSVKRFQYFFGEWVAAERKTTKTVLSNMEYRSFYTRPISAADVLPSLCSGWPWTRSRFACVNTDLLHHMIVHTIASSCKMQAHIEIRLNIYTYNMGFHLCNQTYRVYFLHELIPYKSRKHVFTKITVEHDVSSFGRLVSHTKTTPTVYARQFRQSERQIYVFVCARIWTNQRQGFCFADHLRRALFMGT